MSKYLYPALFEKEDCGYSVSFPDLEGCVTSGETLEEALEMAQDALCLMLYDMEESGQPAPKSSPVKSISAEGENFVSLVACDTIEYRKFYDNKAVKKTLSIPSWLNTMAERDGVNFSAVLQEGLKERLHIVDR